MMKTLIQLIIILSASLAYSQCLSTDLIRNPNFEQDSNEYDGCGVYHDICQWYREDGAVTYPTDNSPPPQEGDYSVCFADGGISQDIDFSPNTDYILNFWVNVPDTVYDSSEYIAVSLRSSTSTTYFAYLRVELTNGWEQVSFPFSIGTDYLDIKLDISGGDGCVDSLELIEVNPTTNSTIIEVPQDYGTIQAAIDAANTNDIVLISPGIYTISETIIVDKPIIVASNYIASKNNADVDATIITGPTNLDPLILFNENSSNAKCIGITFSGARKQLTLECEFMSVTNCKFHDNGSDAVSIEAGGGYIACNYFENNGDEAIDADDSLDWVAEYNTIINPGDDGIEIRLHNNDASTRTHIIRYNYISGADEDGIQLIDYDGDSGREFKIHNNIIRNSAMVGLGCTSGGNTVEDFEGSYMEELALVYNNVFDNNNYGVTGANNMLLVNNIIVNNETVGVKKLDNNSFSDYNCLFNNGTDFDNAVQDPNNIFTDPLLNTDYSLMEISQCIDAAGGYGYNNGLYLPYEEYYFGVRPDIGAIEFGSDVSETNNAPTIVLGPDLVLLSPEVTQLLPGTVSDDNLPENSVVTVLWTIESGPESGNAVFDDAAAAETEVTFNKQGTYVLKLTATDGEETSSDSIKVFFVNDFNDSTEELTGSDFFEAEDYRYLVGSAEVIGVTEASASEVVTAPHGNGIYAYTEYSIVTFTEGTYYVWINASGLDVNSNSLNVSFNDLAEEFPIETATTNEFGDDSWVMVQFDNIPEGVYPLRIMAAEEGVSWDRLFITSDPTETPLNTDLLSVYDIYPVPNEGRFNIALKNGEFTKIRVYDVNGRLVHETSVSDTFFTFLDIGAVNKGVYFVQIENGVRKAIKKIIID